MPAEFRSNLGAFIGASERAIQAGLIAAAELYMGVVRERLLKGYTSGAFVTGNVAGSVDKDGPHRGPDGWEIAIGSNVDYALYWEVGHINLFLLHTGVMGGYARIPIWEPTMAEMRDELVGIVVEEIRAVDGTL